MTLPRCCELTLDSAKNSPDAELFMNRTTNLGLKRLTQQQHHQTSPSSLAQVQTKYDTALHSLCLTLILTTTHATPVVVLVLHLYSVPCAPPVTRP